MARIIIRAKFEAPAAVWLDHMNDVFETVTAHCTGDVSTCPAPNAQFVDWFFQNTCDAMWFVLKYGGEEVTYEYDRYGLRYEHDED